MYLLEIDHKNNRVHLTLSERFDEAQAHSLLRELRQRFEELGEDFHVLCDMTSLTEFEHSARPHFRAMMDVCNEGGVKKIIRILPNPLHDFGLTVMSHFHYGNGVQIVTCKTFDEALKHLR